jgi:hypothetical protein
VPIAERTACRVIMASTARAKPTWPGWTAVVPYTVLTMGRFLAAQAIGVGAVTAPMFTLAISNVPGPTQALFYNGASVEAICPISVLPDGQALDITALSYAGRLEITAAPVAARPATDAPTARRPSRSTAPATAAGRARWNRSRPAPTRDTATPSRRPA